MSYANMRNKRFTGRFQQPFAFILMLGLLSMTLTGCQLTASKIDKQYQDGIPRSSGLAILPFISHTRIPDEETIQLKRILLVQLASAGITNTTVFKQPETNPAPSYLADIYELERAQLWAKSNNINLSMSGEILEWQYDEHNRFSTVLQLKVTDIASGETIWSINGLGEGRPDEAAYEVSRKLIADLVAAMPLQ
ncbi:hypothetical protein [Endozoicomonas sp. SCSIO W0465]|uniref:hypothetical protein n=1 Tax=Endozoicomonas sp. SCSIO W0465 TaxID=2918516 RepID=UPI002074D876|nr:hypothetical protein [Endozoicomonas sp. SCSIO W0465]USE36881.1 hypothetical protein MJO57_01145 [Endozoicomonas sp. SCSIO W0465]